MLMGISVKNMFIKNELRFFYVIEFLDFQNNFFSKLLFENAHVKMYQVKTG